MFLNQNPNKMVIRGNHSLNDSSSKRNQLFVNLIRMTTTINYEKRMVSILYLFNLNNHYMLEPTYFIGLIKPTEIQEFLEDRPSLFGNSDFLFVKGSPFTNKPVQDFLDNNQVHYNYVNKKEIPLIVRISTLYMKRMVEINLEKNESLESNYLCDLRNFWNEDILFVTHNLASEDLMKKTRMTDKLKEELFKRFEKSDSYQMQENKPNYLYLLVIVKRYLKSKAPETSLVLLNLFNGEIVTMKQFIGYKNDAVVLKFLKSHPFYEGFHHFILLPKGAFELEDKFEEYCRRHGYVYDTYENLPENEPNEYVWAASKIVQNYIRDSSNQLVPFVEANSKDTKKAFLQHWNNHVVYIFSDQVKLALKRNKEKA